MNDCVASLADPNACVDGVTPNLPQDVLPVPAVSVLVFPDSYGYCNGILQYSPFPMAKKKVVTRAPASITAKEVKKLLADRWDYVIFGAGMDAPECCTASGV